MSPATCYVPYRSAANVAPGSGSHGVAKRLAAGRPLARQASAMEEDDDPEVISVADATDVAPAEATGSDCG